MLFHLFLIAVMSLLLIVKSSAAPSAVPSNSLFTEGHRVNQPVRFTSNEDEPLARPVISAPLAAIQKPTYKPVAVPVVVSGAKPLQNPQCTLKHYNSDGKEEEGAPCSTISPSLKKSIKPTVSTGSSSTKPIYTVSPTKTTSPVLKICQYSGYCNSNSDCQPGNYCRLDRLPWYSQCLADVSTYKTSNCKLNWGTQCLQDTDCCDPGAFCNSNPYRQCQQPAIGSAGCLDPAKGNFPTNSPSRNCFAKRYDENGEYEESVPCPTNSPSFSKSVKPTVSTGSPTIGPLKSPTALLTKEPALNPSLIPFVNPTFNPTVKPVVSLTSKPSVNPTTSLGQAVVIFNTYLNLQLVDCDALKLCTPCQHAIELAQQQVINSTLHQLANVTYIDCIVGRRRLSESSRHLAISSNVTLITTFFSLNPIEDSDIAKATVVSSVQNGIYTTLVQDNSQKLNATATKNTIVRSVALGTSTFLTFSPTVQPSKVPSSQPFSSSTTPSSVKPAYFPSIRPVASKTAAPSDTPSNNPSKRVVTNSPTLPPSMIPSFSPSIIDSTKITVTPTKIRSLTPTKKISTYPSSTLSVPPSDKPTIAPTKAPTIGRNPSVPPSDKPTIAPTKAPTIGRNPSVPPSDKPTIAPTNPSIAPSDKLSSAPTRTPTLSRNPSIAPSDKPSINPSVIKSDCLVIENSFISDNQFQSNSTIKCVIVPSTVTSIGMMILI